MQDLLDPIDWAIYGMHLWKNESTFYQRARILYGCLLLSKRVHNEVRSLPHIENILYETKSSK